MKHHAERLQEKIFSLERQNEALRAEVASKVEIERARD